MIDRHIHRFQPGRVRTAGILGTGFLARWEDAFICECGITTEQYTEQIRGELIEVKKRLAGFDHGDGEICEDDHPVQRRDIGFGGAPPGSMPPGM